jgi:hypothetical protein
MATDAQQQPQTQQQQSGAAMGGQQRAERVYETEEIILKARMLEVDFIANIIFLIEQESLSKRAKIALASVVYMGFDKNAVLANNPNIDERVLRFEEALNKAKLSYSRPDAMNPAIVYLHETIRQSFRDFISRSINMGERRMQGEKKLVSVYNTPESDERERIQRAQQGGQRKHGLDIGKIIRGE